MVIFTRGTAGKVIVNIHRGEHVMHTDAGDGGVPLLQDYLRGSAARYPDKVALVCGGRRLTYRELDNQSTLLAQTFLRAGVRRGDRVMVFADNTVETVVAFWAALKASAVATLVNPLTKQDKLDYLLNDCQPSAMVTDHHLRQVYQQPVSAARWLRCTVVSGTNDASQASHLPGGMLWAQALVPSVGEAEPTRRCIDHDLAAIVYTSGSTGEPKGVMLSHRNMLTAATSISTYLGMVADDIIINVLPMAFDYGLYQMIMAFRQGARLVLERSFAFPAQVLSVMAAEKVTGFPGVPTIFSILTEFKALSSYDLSSLRFVTNTAANLPVKHILRLQEMFPQATIFSMYGLTECKRCTYLPPAALATKPTSVGIAIPNTELWLIDDDGKKLSPNQIGQLVIRGATVMKGYWRKPEQTAKKLKFDEELREYVLHTGDLCRLDDEGYLYFVARQDDIIKSRGEKVSPKEVEQVLVNIPGVREAAVIGVPDDVLGQAIKAFVVLEPDAGWTPRDIQIQCQTRLENFMVPKFIEVVAELPKTDTGKIKKTGLV